MNTKIGSLLHWTPRVLVVLYAAFISLFALDVWDMDGSVLERLGGFLIHLLPTFVLLATLLIAWKRPTVGGLLFLGIALLFTVFFNWTADWPTLLILGTPLVVIGVLFLWDGRTHPPTLSPST